MGLPKIDLPLFETKIFSTGETIKYRPFTVKEEKILLMAQESGDNKQISLAMKQIINSCITNSLDVDTLPMFDIEYLMLQIRAKSVNNVINFTLIDPDTEKPVTLELNIDDIEFVTPEGHSKEIKVSEDIRLIMRYPALDEVNIFLASDDVSNVSADTAFSVMTSCIENVINGDEVAKLTDYSKEEVEEFINGFPSSAMEELKNFFETMPRLSYTAKYTDSEGEEKEMLLEGTETFFL